MDFQKKAHSPLAAHNVGNTWNLFPIPFLQKHKCDVDFLGPNDFPSSEKKKKKKKKRLHPPINILYVREFFILIANVAVHRPELMKS
jgi:hypothetical protein